MLKMIFTSIKRTFAINITCFGNIESPPFCCFNRISSLSFRSDLSWGGVFSELSQTLANQRLRRMSHKWESRSMEIRKSFIGTTDITLDDRIDNFSSEKKQPPNDDYILKRVGRDQGVHVSGDEVVVLMAVANETNNTIILSNRKVNME